MSRNRPLAAAPAVGLDPPGPPAEPPPRATLFNVQALRAVAAFMVVCVHLQALVVMGGAPPRIVEAGNAGVDLFFVISGFIMVFTTGRKPQGPLAFLGSRLRRIAPLYWSVTLAVFAIARFAPALIQNTPSDVRRLVDALLFIPTLRPDGTMRPVVFVGWTLNFEMAFYALFALGLLAPRRWIGVLAAVGVLVLAVLWGWATHPSSPVLGFYTTPMVLEFGLGMLLGLAWPHLRPPQSLVRPLEAAAAVAFALILGGPWLWPQADRLVAFGLPAAVIVAAALAVEQRGRAVRWPWLQALGAASYAIYLSHFFVTQAVILLARKLGQDGPWAAAVASAAAFVGVALAGLALHRTLEQGADRLIGRLLSTRAPSSTPAPGFVKVKSVS
ncbi:MAG: acyltransferase family protein [Caulobacteraceae bacterium]